MIFNIRLLKCAMLITILVSFGGCAMKKKDAIPLSISMILMNHGQPFISKAIAERICLLIIEDRYSKEIFLAKEPSVVEDKDDFWLVTFQNSLISNDGNETLPVYNNVIVPRRLSFKIRKINAEIVDIF